MTDERIESAQRRAEHLSGFAVHLLAFLIVNTVLLVQEGFQPGAGYLWGWGIGVGAHAFGVLGPGTRFKQRLVERELARGERR